MAVEIIFGALLLTGIDGLGGCIGPLPVSRDDPVVTGQGSGGRFRYLEIVRPHTSFACTWQIINRLLGNPPTRAK